MNEIKAIVTIESGLGYKDGDSVPTEFKRGDEIEGALAVNWIGFGWAKKIEKKKRGRKPKGE